MIRPPLPGGGPLRPTCRQPVACQNEIAGDALRVAIGNPSGPLTVNDAG